MNRSRYGGDMMTQRVYEAITRDTSYDVSPMYGFRKEIVNGTSSTTYLDTSDIRESYHLYNKMVRLGIYLYLNDWKRGFFLRF